MDEAFSAGLKSLVDHAEWRGLEYLRFASRGEEIELWLRRPAALARPGMEVAAQGPGVFRAAHPDTGKGAPCLEAGDFLFPLSVREGAPLTLLVQDGDVVGYGTPLLRQPL